MAFWNSDRIKKEQLKHNLVTPYEPSRVVRCAYELGVGDEAYITSKSGDNTLLKTGDKVVIPAGQFGLLITREIIYVPDTAIAFISIKAGIKFKGLVNVSGFHVDPGFKGQLKFAVYNAGSSDIDLDQDQPVFLIWYADLDAPTTDLYPKKLETHCVISAEDISRIKGDVASPAVLKKQIEELKKDLENLVSEQKIDFERKNAELRADIEKKQHETEHLQLVNRNLILMVVGSVVPLILTTIIRLLPDVSSGAQNTAKVIIMPKYIGPCAIAASVISVICFIVADIRLWRLKK